VLVENQYHSQVDDESVGSRPGTNIPFFRSYIYRKEHDRDCKVFLIDYHDLFSLILENVGELHGLHRRRVG